MSFSSARRSSSLHQLTCAHLRTSFTVWSPSFTHSAAADFLGEMGGQRMFAAPGLRCYTEALTLLRWRLSIWQRRQRQDFIWERESQLGMKILLMKSEEERNPVHAPTHLFRSNTKPALQEHLKLPSVFRQSPFWQTPCMEHSLMSSRLFKKKKKKKLYYHMGSEMLVVKNEKPETVQKT